MFDISEVSRALARHSPKSTDPSARRKWAAVAIILSGPEDTLSVCMIRRAAFETDVWSGHVALPGGIAQPGEESAANVAERETFEEVGLRINDTHRIGSLSDIVIRLAGREHELTVSPVVYSTGTHLSPLLASVEVAEAFWVPVADLWNVRNATFLALRDQEDVMVYPAIRVGDRWIWGVTLRILTLFSDVIGHPLPHFEEIPGLRSRYNGG